MKKDKQMKINWSENIIYTGCENMKKFRMTIRKPCHCRAGTPIPAVVFLLLFVVFAAAPAAAQDAAAGDEPPAATTDTTEAESASPAASEEKPFIDELHDPATDTAEMDNTSPTAALPDGCEADLQRLDAWSMEHPEEADAIAAKYLTPEVQALLDVGEFEAVRKPMILSATELLQASGGNPECAEPITDFSLSLLQGFSGDPATMDPGMSESVSVGSPDVIEDMKAGLAAMLGACEAEFKALDAWGEAHPEEALDMLEKYGDVQAMMDAREYDAARAPMIKATAEALTAAELDPACAEPITDYTIAMFRGLDAAFEEVTGEEEAETAETDSGETPEETPAADTAQPPEEKPEPEVSEGVEDLKVDDE